MKFNQIISPMCPGIFYQDLVDVHSPGNPGEINQERVGGIRTRNLVKFQPDSGEI